MCTGCTERVEKLRELVYRFDDMAERATDPLERARLRHTAIDLGLIAEEMGDGCAACAALATIDPGVLAKVS